MQISDAGALESLAQEIIAANPKEAADYRAGKTKVMGFFVGQLMKQTKGQANPQLANEIFKRLLVLRMRINPLRPSAVSFERRCAFSLAKSFAKSGTSNSQDQKRTMIPYCSICWDIDKVKLLDQRRLPREEIYLEITDYHEVIEAIRTLAIRGAPAIGVAAAMGAALGALAMDTEDPVQFQVRFQEICREISQARPTAVNLFWALDRMLWWPSPRRASRWRPQRAPGGGSPDLLKEDETINRHMAQAGQVLIHDGQRVITHCNTGALATGAYGTALGVLRAAWEAGKRFSVWVDETRPLLQGARLTTWELGKLGIPYTLIPGWGGRGPDEPGQGGPGHRGRGPHCRQRRRGQQDRHLWVGGPGAPPRDPLLCGRAPVHL